MRRHERPPLLDYAVFGTAAVLAVIVGYYALVKQPWKRPAGSIDRSADLGELVVPVAETRSVPMPAPQENTLGASGTHAIAGQAPGMKSSGRPAPKKKKR